MITATTEIVVGIDRRRHSVVRRMRCEVPMLVRVVDGTGPVLHLAMVNGAAGPLGGDQLRFRLEVEAGANVVVRSVAAALAQPGPGDEASQLHVDLEVGPQASLEWLPQPTLSVMRSVHRSIVSVVASSTSAVRMCEGVVLGRHGEPSGSFSLRERVTIDDVGVLDHETAFAPGALMGAGAQGSTRTMSTDVMIGSELPEPRVEVNDRWLRSTVHLSPICALTICRAN